MCAILNKREQIVEILNELFKTKRNIWTKQEIETAIMTCRGVDPRTLKNWFAYLWKLEFFEQPQNGKYVLNFARLEALEIRAPLENDPVQTRFVVIRGGKDE